uniref:NADH-ubiquinone oxidoreductase chain 4L n=1 Tax=Paradyschiria parvula TaxID=2572155 RepID=A0A5B9RJK6_9MUSC|nr:NADH dehydrogenase subunit 4l [Paradyschiria parvula]QEG77640.1 NADH dehydrogenase subunit 4l [Paradyschiria parvula]
MMSLYMWMYCLVFFSGCISFVMSRKHLLMMLLSLEFIVLSLFMMLMNMLSNFQFEYNLILIYLIFSVCEGALGLSILVSIIRTHGNDYFQSFNVLW